MFIHAKMQVTVVVCAQCSYNKQAQVASIYQLADGTTVILPTGTTYSSVCRLADIIAPFLVLAVRTFRDVSCWAQTLPVAYAGIGEEQQCHCPLVVVAVKTEHCGIFLGPGEAFRAWHKLFAKLGWGWARPASYPCSLVWPWPSKRNVNTANINISCARPAVDFCRLTGSAVLQIICLSINLSIWRLFRGSRIVTLLLKK